MGLTVKRVEKLLRAGVPGRHTDGAGGVRGLMLCIESKTSAHWLLRYQRNHVIRNMGLGSARDLGLAAARERARRERERLAAGMDPLALRRAERDAAAAAAAKRLTFREAAERCHEALAAGWSSAHHANEFLSSLERWVYPHIRGLDVAAVDKDAVLRVMEQRLPPKQITDPKRTTFWTARTVTADRTRNRIERVLDWAEARGFRPAGIPNPARWKGFLENLLAKPRDIAPVKNLRAVPYAEVPGLMTVLAADKSVGAQALRFVVMTASRLGEGLGASWDEINFETAEWVIPKERMKARREHRVPLAPQVIDLLKSLYREDGNPYLFIGAKGGGHVAETTVTQALRNAKRDETVHGFRSSFRTWVEERTSFPSIVAEMALAHNPGSAVEKAYRRGDLAEKRAKLMQLWAAYCSTPAAGKVLTMRKVAST